jgi:hypothetical protein
MVLLAAGLSSVELLPGQPLPGSGAEGGGGSLSILSLSDKLLEVLFRVFGFILLVLLPLAILFFIRSPAGKRRGPLPFGILLWFLLLYGLLRSRQDFPEPVDLEPPSTIVLPDAQAPVVEVAGPPSPTLVWVSTGGIALLIAGLVVAGAWILWRRRRAKPGGLARLAVEARSALDALSAGAKVEDVVLRSYFEMARIIEQERGVVRAGAMTPREFEAQLKALGLPAEDVEQLTRLFEAVRYGRWVAGEQEKRQAMACLTAIAESSRSAS